MSQVALADGTACSAEQGATILDSALAQGNVLEHGCRTGRCGSCKARLTHRTTSDYAVCIDDMGSHPEAFGTEVDPCIHAGWGYDLARATATRKARPFRSFEAL